jgi:pimeloyl-ACP methyl ester carboxylesterase
MTTEAMRELRVTVGGETMRCLTVGSGTPLLLCHGFLSSAEEFGGRFSALAAQRQLIIPDLPGNGESAPLRRRHTVDALAASLHELLDRLGVERFDLAGLCLGASVASALADRCGDRVQRLLLHTPLLAPSLIRWRFRGQIAVLTFPPLWRGVVALSRNRRVSDLYKRYVVAEGDVDDATAEINFTNQRRADPAAAREWLRDSVRRCDLDIILGRERPTLVILAANDQVINAEVLARLIAEHPQVQLVVDSGQGHGWNHEAVQRQLTVMSRFFADSAEPPRRTSARVAPREAGGGLPRGVIVTA